MSLFRFQTAVVLGLFVVLAACASTAEPQSTAASACADRTLNVGFYAYFQPVSYSANEDPDSADFHTHLGYEADLLDALEAMEGTGLTFSRRGIAEWDGIWLKPAAPEYDLAAGGITILDSRTRDATGQSRVMFTSGHITFRQSLLVRAEDAARIDDYDSLTSEVRVGVLPATTGEARLLQITGLTDADGILAAGARIETPQGMVTADGTADYVITAADESPALARRTKLYPPSDGMPQVVYLGDVAGEAELIQALATGAVDALARGQVGNRDAAHASDNSFVVSVLYDAVELGGFTVAAEDAALASCLDERIDWLTDNRRIGLAEWLEDPEVFMGRAALWPDTAR